MKTHSVYQAPLGQVRRFGWLLLGLAAMAPGWLPAAGLPEPDTTVYGQIVNRTTGQPFLVTTGAVAWTMRSQTGKAMTLQAPLQPLKNGEFSYRLRVPHEALVPGVTVSADAFPLMAEASRFENVQITVNGSAARVISPNGSALQLSQNARAATYRIDLEVFDKLADSDGDGLPDWWELKYGLNPFLASDAKLDSDGDGVSNLAEFRKGTNPLHDDRSPSLPDTLLTVYADATSVVPLHAVDLDSDPANLTYTLTSIPQGGALYLRAANAASPVALAAGMTFSQADVNQGRLLYVHGGSNETDTAATFAVQLQDESTNHAAFAGEVNLAIYRPQDAAALAEAVQAQQTPGYPTPNFSALPPDEQQRIVNYLLGRDAHYVIYDDSNDSQPQRFAAPSAGLSLSQYQNIFVPQQGPDRQFVVAGGTSPDQLAGGMEADVLVGRGAGELLTGNGGADVFVIYGRDNGKSTIADFNPAEGDVLDLSKALGSAGGYVTNFLSLTATATNTLIGLNLGGTGGSFTNMTITLNGVSLANSNLYDLVESGRILTGNKVFAPRVSIVATVPNASENGPVPGRFTVSRSGPVAQPLSVNLQITGSAVNGYDYQQIPSVVTFEPGVKAFDLVINPYVTPSTLYTQFVQVAIVASSNFTVGVAGSAQVSIEPLMSQISITALEPVAVKNTLTPAVFLVSRGGLVDRSTLVRLTIGGNAANGIDYDTVSSFINFAPQQTTALISITPKATGVITNGAESVVLSIKADPSYKIMNPAQASAVLVEQLYTVAAWRQKFFPGNAGDVAAFAAQDPDHTGIKNLYRYAFGLDPANPKNSTGQPRFSIKGNRFQVSFHRPAAVTDVDYFVELSSDMKNWHGTSTEVEDVSSAADPETATFQSVQQVNSNKAMFMRVRVALKP